MTTPTAPVYIVDDDASVREAVGRLVRSAGWKVETFASAQEFLASPWADVPSCLILDVRLPGTERSRSAAAACEVRRSHLDHFSHRPR